MSTPLFVALVKDAQFHRNRWLFGKACILMHTMCCRMIVGCTLAVLGFTMYSYASIESRQRKTLTVYTSGMPQSTDKDTDDSITNPLLERKVSQV